MVRLLDLFVVIAAFYGCLAVPSKRSGDVEQNWYHQTTPAPSLPKIGIPFEGIYLMVTVVGDEKFAARLETVTNQRWAVGETYAYETGRKRFCEGYETSKKDVVDTFGSLTLIGENRCLQNNGYEYVYNCWNVITSAQSYPVVNPKLNFDAVVGLAWLPGESTVSHVNSSVIIQMLYNMPNKQFSIWADKYTSPTVPFQSSRLTLGAIDEQNCQKDLQWFPIIGNGFLNPPNVFEIANFRFGNYTHNAQSKGFLDIGTPLIHFPAHVVAEIQKILCAVWNSEFGVYIPTCFQETDIIFELPGGFYNLSSTDYMVEMEGVKDYVLAIGEENYLNADIGLGLPFLHKYCYNFDITNNKVGISTSIPLSF